MSNVQNTSVTVHLIPLTIHKPKMLGSRPCDNPKFTGRGDLLEILHTTFRQAKANPVIQVIYGTGGLGKTQTANRCFSQQSSDKDDKYDGLFWITANQLDDCYKKLAEDLKLIADDDIGKLALLDLQKLVHQALMEKAYQKVLIVFDDVTNEGVFSALCEIWQQGDAQVNVLLTSRYSQWGDMVAHELRGFSEAETSQYVDTFFSPGQRAPFIKPTASEIAAFHQTFDGLPLA